ncbi:hypothetical protein CMQ_2424 [Grosmannia clavigera kw1407]|uniref:Uncharacterized protein n=1 Tax=Grosmannia clavigera (strain kw1407 / UAMH 11150) TaxID=655863 RepID=F0XJG2_GROCL|nr:uncharacterized protein CMQ_2424 [Grosmannia clavigera kw1407]EFX02375.1 hypothetical protein CMQ_2424 [Grosmannia clavigera kw1407]
MSDAILVPALSVILAIVYLFYLGSEGTKTLEAAFVTPARSEDTDTPIPFTLAQQDPFSLRSYAGFGLGLVPMIVGVMFFAFRMARMYKEAK